MSYDENQLPLPPSFHALYTDARQRLTAPLLQVQARYELCEDLAQHLVEQTQGLHQDSLREQREILQRYQQALAAPEAGLTQAEPHWVVRRLAELLGWPDEAANAA
ncbi:hypothetical protein AAFF27_26685 [Xylophilus sp. GW821-FHT01B05]